MLRCLAIADKTTSCSPDIGRRIWESRCEFCHLRGHGPSLEASLQAAGSSREGRALFIKSVIFPNAESSLVVHGMRVYMVSTGTSDDEACALLSYLLSSPQVVSR